LRDELIKKTTGMKATTVEELDSTFNLLGVLRRKQIDKRVLRSGRGPWAAVAFKFEEVDPASNEWTHRMMLAMFKKVEGYFTRYSYFNIRNREEAQQICNLIKEWWDL
jgi:hypothetical protein